MSLQHTVFVLASGLLFSATAQAQVGITADLGTTGVGAHLVVPMANHLNGRFGLNYLKHDFTTKSGSIDYDLKGKLQTFDVLFDWYLREGSSFRLTGGIVYNGSRFDARANPGRLGGLTVNGVQYTAADIGVLNGKVDFRKAAPYLGIGWGNALAPQRASGWSLNADVGAFYQGKARVSLASSGCTTSQAVCDRLAADVASERARLSDDASSYKIYPVLRASIAYRF
jgi:hypothetical protein